ncbi:hypothetical protein C0993_010466 [Termitomyces sp. T159_Od127]|nr:hypothetical protein C0993_010466 [Termitomyces sp. T159_Od127]
MAPWYLTTFAIAEQLYDALIVWKNAGSLNVTSLSLPFFANLVPGTTVGTYFSDSTTFTIIIAEVETYANSFYAVASKYMDIESLSEQFTRMSGTPISAKYFTWSYVALFTVANAMNGWLPASWGATGLEVPATCVVSEDPTVVVTFNVNATTFWGGM